MSTRDAVVALVPAAGRGLRLGAQRPKALVPVLGESFIQWVMEDRFVAGRPAFEQVGVELRDDVALFEAVKGRMLNAAHMTLSYPALMCGFRLVDEAMREPAARAFLDAFLTKDVMPLVEGPAGVSLDAYKAMILERFSNPAIGDQWERIANLGAAKLPVFLTKTVQQLVGRGGPFDRVALTFACFARYLTGADMRGGAIRVDEPQLTADDHALLASGDPLAVLRLSSFAPMGLAESAAFVDVFTATQARVQADGPVAALARAAAA